MKGGVGGVKLTPLPLPGKITCAYVANVSVCQKLVWMKNSRIRLKFKGSSLKQEDEAAFTPKNVVTFLIVYELDTWSRDLATDFTLKNYLFGYSKLIKNSDTDKYNYNGYRIGFDCRSKFPLPVSSMGKNPIIFGADMCSSVHIDIKNKDILILSE